MKVLCVNATLDPVHGGGTAERTFQLGRFLARRGVKTRMLTMDVGITEQRRRELSNVELIALPCINRRFFVPRGGLRKIREAVVQSDIVHIMGHWTVLNALVARAARQFGKPYIHCPAGALPIYGRSQMLKRLYNRVCGNRIIGHAQSWIAISPAEPAQLREHGVSADRVVHIPNGIDPDAFRDAETEEFRRRHNLGNHPLLLFLGRLNSIKGPDLLLEAFLRCAQDHPEFHLVFAGPDSGMQSSLEQSVQRAGLDERVHFVGFLGGVEKSQAYHAADLLVIPSRQEAMSIVVLEAGITGTPVLLTDQCGFNLVEDIQGGRVVPADVAGLERGLRDLLANRDQLPNYGKRLERFTLENYCWDSIVERHIHLFQKILAGENLPAGNVAA
ncbi:MAG: hypothetical protein Tsb009_10510 [Planctomycetaceae bacterium]